MLKKVTIAFAADQGMNQSNRVKNGIQMVDKLQEQKKDKIDDGLAEILGQAD